MSAPRSEPGDEARCNPPGLLQQQPYANIRILESTSFPTGDVEVSNSVSNTGWIDLRKHVRPPTALCFMVPCTIRIAAAE